VRHIYVILSDRGRTTRRSGCRRPVCNTFLKPAYIYSKAILKRNKKTEIDLRRIPDEKAIISSSGNSGGRHFGIEFVC
jgi:hypothetical protein